MAERSDEIRQKIDAQRGELGENLHELERRVRDTTDWRAHMEKRPWVMLGLAFGTGVVLSGVVGSRGHSWKHSYRNSYGQTPSYSDESGYGTWTSSSVAGTSPATNRFSNVRQQKSRATEALDKMTAALMAVGVQKLQDVLGDAIPGFRDKYDHLQAGRQGESEFERGESGSHSREYDRSPSQAYNPSPTPAM